MPVWSIEVTTGSFSKLLQSPLVRRRYVSAQYILQRSSRGDWIYPPFETSVNEERYLVGYNYGSNLLKPTEFQQTQRDLDVRIITIGYLQLCGPIVMELYSGHSHRLSFGEGQYSLHCVFELCFRFCTNTESKNCLY